MAAPPCSGGGRGCREGVREGVEVREALEVGMAVAEGEGVSLPPKMPPCALAEGVRMMCVEEGEGERVEGGWRLSPGGEGVGGEEGLPRGGVGWGVGEA
jgi:hypothetical protein